MKTAKKNQWLELTQKEDKESFKHIVLILQRYYKMNPIIDTKNSIAFNFREEIVRTDIEALRIFLKKFGEYEFLVVVEIKKVDVKDTDSWIHVDGITQERIICKQKGIKEHPVFRIKSLADLYENPLNAVIKDLPKNEEKPSETAA